MNEKKIAFIIKITNEFYTEQCLDFISKIEIPEGYDKEIIKISDYYDDSDAFEKGDMQTNAYYKVYLSDNTLLINTKLLYEVERIFENDEERNCITLKGSEFDGISVHNINFDHKSFNVYVTRKDGSLEDDNIISTSDIDENWLYTDSSIGLGDENTEGIGNALINFVNKKRYKELYSITDELKTERVPDEKVRIIYMLGDIYKLEEDSIDRIHSEIFDIDGFENIYTYFQIIKTFIVKAGLQNDHESILFLKEMHQEKKISEDMIITMASAVLKELSVIYGEILEPLNEYPLISIILPAYNTGEIIRDTIESCINQDYDNLELIIVDDASTDNTPSIIKEYEEKDRRIKAIYSKTNMHICASSLMALKEAKGKYIAPLGHDDVFYLQKFVHQVRFMEHHIFYGVCFSWTDIINEFNETINEKKPGAIRLFCKPYISRAAFYQMFANTFAAPSAMIRRNCIDDVGFYRMGLVQLQDYDLWLRIFAKYDYYIMPQVLIKYRQFANDTENRHLSTFTPEKENRGMHENIWLIYDIIMKLSSETFKMLFDNKMINKEANSEEEILCEKILLLKSRENPFTYVEFLRNLDREEFTDTLLNKYGFSIQDFYKYNTKQFNLDNHVIRYALALEEKCKELMDN